MSRLNDLAAQVAERLKARRETVAIAESSAGGLISAALLAVPGASAYFLGGAVVYTGKARMEFLRLRREDVAHVRSGTEAYAQILAETVRENLGATWGLSETGAAGPGGQVYGHSAMAVAGPIATAFTLETGHDDRVKNMDEFAGAALNLLLQMLETAPA
jgi:PncC family amidohydrolase